MPIAMGILCENCGIVYLITAAPSNRIACVPQAGSETFALSCNVCGTTRSFHKPDLKAYQVSAGSYACGYAERGEYSVREQTRISLRKPRS
jgi:hypothetical protein